MLESLRKQGSSVFIYVIFGVLIAAFVINFGPQRGQNGGCRGTDNTSIEVDGNTVSQSAYHIAYSNPFNPGVGKQKVYVALETLIRRELLADEAESRGISVSSDLMDEEIKRGNFYLGGQRVPLRGNIFDEVDGEQFFNIRKLKAWVAGLNLSSMNAYKEEQQRALEAGLMAQILGDSVQVSRDEALDRFLYDGTTVTYDVVAFKPSAYRAAMKLTDADLTRFMSTHDADMQKQYKADERTYKGTKPAMKLREIYIAKAEPKAAPTTPAPAPAPTTPAPTTPAPTTPPATAPTKPAEAPAAPVDDSKAKLEAARAEITAGKLKFADAAHTLSTTEADKELSGELGWRTVDAPQLGDKAVNDAIKTMKPGDVSPVISTDHGSYLVTVEDKREGDLSYDQVKLEIARELAKDIWSKEAARRAAITALATARAGTAKNLAQMFDADEPPPSHAPNQLDIEKLLNNPRFTDEQKQQLRERFKHLQPGGPTTPTTPPPAGSAAPTPPTTPPAGSGDAHGSREVHTRDVPAGWFAGPDGAGGGSGSATGSATGSANGSASGSAAGSGTMATPVEAQDPMKPSSDVLPAFGPIAKPTLEHEDSSPRGYKMPGIVGAKAAVDALFDDLQPGNLGKTIYESDGNYVIIQEIAKDSPKMEDFDKEAPLAMEAMRRARASAFLEQWLGERCNALNKAGKIHAAPDLIHETDDQGKALPTVYHPCMSFASPAPPPPPMPAGAQQLNLAP